MSHLGVNFPNLIIYLLVCTVPLALLLWLVALAVLVRSLHRQVDALRAEVATLSAAMTAGNRSVPAVLAAPSGFTEPDDDARSQA